MSSDIRKGYEAAAKALAERAAGHYKLGNYDLQDECLQCASMLHDLKPAATAPIVAQPVVVVDERAAFDQWMSDEGKTPKAIERNGDGYRLAQAAFAWWVWQAAWKVNGNRSSTIPPGWQLVPEEPTADMAIAYNTEAAKWCHGPLGKKAYAALLAAAPAAPTDGEA